MARRPRSHVNWANVLTWTRLALILPITIAAYFDAQWFVLVLFIVAMLTDFLDGKVARWTGTASPKGAVFDSNVDLAFLVATVAWLWMLVPSLVAKYWVWACIFFASEFTAQLIVRRKLRVTSGLHLYSGKAAAVSLFVLFPATIIWGEFPALIYTVIAIGMIACVEAIAYVLKGGKNLDARWVFDK